MPDLVNGNYPVKNPGWQLNGYPNLQTGSVRCNYDPVPWHLLATSQALVMGTTGQAIALAINLYAGDSINRLHLLTGSTAGATLTNGFAALYTPAGALISQSTSRENVVYASGIPTGGTAITGIAANTNSAFTLGSNATPTPYVVPTTGVYFAVFSQTGGTMPTLAGLTMGNLLNSGNISGLAAASRVASGSSSPFQVTQGLASGTAGNYLLEAPKAQLLASTYTATAPALLTTNGAPTGLAALPVCFTS